jgi:hypothetical protein
VSETIPLTTLPHFLEAVLEFSDADIVVFRGHHSSRWSLQPRLARLAIRDTSVLNTETELIEAFRRRCLPYLALRVEVGTVT